MLLAVLSEASTMPERVTMGGGLGPVHGVMLRKLIFGGE